MNLINELRELAEDLHVNGYNRYSAAMSKAADELGSLERYRPAYNEWVDKTEWVQAEASLPAKYLGMHRADVLKDMISELEERLKEAEQDALEQARLNGMGAERELTLMTKLEAAEKEHDALRVKIAEMGQPGAEWFDWLPQGTTHISSIRTVTIPCFGFEARFNAFKYIDGVLYTYRTDTDNEYGEWVKADSRYRDGVLPTVYPLSGAQPAPSVPDDISRRSTRLLERAAGHLRWLKKDTYQWQCLNPKTKRAAALLRRDIDAMLAAVPETKP